ncbi:MAG TPA: hypothetical protein VND24_04735 [Steroidobacteraceae bacterium]|nr:hypothetical protein [Steroidobacteraceae bacterium]
MKSDPLFGLCCSQHRATELGLDPTETFLATLIHLRPRLVRLPLSWDEIAPEPGRYDLAGIRWRLDRAEEHGCRVLLSVGIRVPDRVGDSIPPWLRDAPGPSPAIGGSGRGRLMANLLLMLERVVAALADYDAIEAWQVEHEPFLPVARSRSGVAIDPALLKREADVVREVDSRHRPIVITHAAGSIFDSRWRAALRIADVIGEDLTLPSGVRDDGRLRRSLRQQDACGRLRLLALAAALQAKPVWITGLQTEPSHAAQGSQPQPAAGRARAIDVMQSQIYLARRSGAARIYLRGAEAWLLRLQRGEQESWDLARGFMSPSP